MDIKQIYGFVNEATEEALGQKGLVAEDLSNIVDVGNAIFNASAMDKYVKALVNRIGKVIFVNRKYEGSAPSVLMDGWEYGSVLQKVSQNQLPEATENETWELQDGQSYDPHVFHQPKGVQAKFYNKYITFEIDMSFTEQQLKMSFTNAVQLNGFISMLYTNVENSMTVKLDELIRRTINNMIGATLHTANAARAINLLTMFKAAYPDTTVTAATALNNPDFIRYACYVIKMTHDRMRTMSTVFNEGGVPRFTPKDMSHIVLLSDFASGADIFLQSNTFHDELSALPTAETVPYWQGSGTGYAFADVSKINVKTVAGDTVEQSGILGVMFDRNALGVASPERKTTSEWTANAEFFTNFYKYKAGYFNDYNENFVVFYIG